MAIGIIANLGSGGDSTESSYSYVALFNGYTADGRTFTATESGTYFISCSVYAQPSEASTLGITTTGNVLVNVSTKDFFVLHLVVAYLTIGQTITIGASSSGAITNIMYVANKNLDVAKIEDKYVNNGTQNAYTYNGSKKCAILNCSISQSNDGTYSSDVNGNYYTKALGYTFSNDIVLFGKKGAYVKTTQGGSNNRNRLICVEFN